MKRMAVEALTLEGAMKQLLNLGIEVAIIAVIVGTFLSPLWTGSATQGNGTSSSLAAQSRR